MDGQLAAFGSVLADVVTGQVRKTEIVYYVKRVLMKKDDILLKALSLGTKQIVLYQVRKRVVCGFWGFLKACSISITIFPMDLLWVSLLIRGLTL